MPDLRFAAPVERRAALITGGARGIGAATALRLAEEGRDIVIADLLEERAQETVAAIEALGQSALFVKTDITDPLQVDAAVAQAVEQYGRLDILVCCAGATWMDAHLYIMRQLKEQSIKKHHMSTV